VVRGTMTRILALVWPELRIPAADASSWVRMLDALDDLSPRVEAVDLGVALVDVTGLGPMWGPERRIAARAVMLARAVAPLRVRCGIGDNRWLAALAARLARFERPDAPAAFRVLEVEELRDLPLDLLPADPATRARFARFGLTRMAQLAELPRSAVGAQFGAAGERLQALARGHDPRPLVPRRRPERVTRRATFEPPLDGVGAVGLTLRRLAAELCDRLRERHLAPGRATLTLVLEDAPAIRVTQAFPQPALEPDWIARLLLSRIEAAARAKTPSSNVVAVTKLFEPILTLPRGPNLVESMTLRGQPARTGNTVAEWQLAEAGDEGEPRIASVRLAFDRLADPATTQLPAFEARAARWEELRWSLERIRHRFGTGRLWRAHVDRPNAALPEHRSRLVDIGA
jgi:nucleotidyltransferase/DNA polymerase involved in DNA repair